MGKKTKYVFQRSTDNKYLRKAVWTSDLYIDTWCDVTTLKFDTVEEASDFWEENHERFDNEMVSIFPKEIAEPIKSPLRSSATDYETRIKDLEKVVGVMKTKIDELEGRVNVLQPSYLRRH